MYTLHTFSSKNELDVTLASAITKQLDEAIALRGKASLAVSGGKTPIHLFKQLSQSVIDWSKVTVTLVDDRWVDENDEASNTHLVKTYLLQNSAKAAHFVSLKTHSNTPFDAENDVEKLVQRRLSLPIDVLILGMGDDGHTASLFPYAAHLANGLDMHSDRLFIGIKPLEAPHERISMTLPLILSSRHLYLHIVGASKRQTLEKALQDDDIHAMPIRAVLLQQKTPVEIYWAE